MPGKYLPIGSVVKVKDLNKKMMIIGYYSLEYQNSVIMYDYVGCAYPEGLLVKNNMFSFNHADIISVDFVGYEDDSYITLNKNLNNQLADNTENMQQPQSFINLKFDENGVVVYEEVSDKKETPQIIERVKKNPFEVNLANNQTATEIPIVKSAFRFDENGVVVEDNSVIQNTKDIESNFNYTFDENGVVTKEVNKNAPALEETENKIDSGYAYTFDENGIVTGVIDNGQNNVTANSDVSISSNGEVSDESSKTIYKFDESGFVIADDAGNTNNNATQEKAEEFPMPHYEFDENGIIINN